MRWCDVNDATLSIDTWASFQINVLHKKYLSPFKIQQTCQ